MGLFPRLFGGPPGVNAMAAITMATTATPTPAVNRPEGTQGGAATLARPTAFDRRPRRDAVVGLSALLCVSSAARL